MRANAKALEEAQVAVEEAERDAEKVTRELRAATDAYFGPRKKIDPPS